ncbi:nuclear transport factor 2 family protein [Haliea sp. E17]|uniref:nuclear transport factor 2 family protein n=1 Tax=Haliea sp. E17 TaxID=3401576 RepID=UPI003AB08A10
MSGISLENRIAIYELIARYSFCVDNYRGEDWADLFLPDGRLVGADIELNGKAGLVGQSDMLKAGPTEYRHVITNVFVEEGATDESAVANAYGTVADWATIPAKEVIFVEYRFDVVRRDGVWKIAEARVHMPYSS